MWQTTLDDATFRVNGGSETRYFRSASTGDASLISCALCRLMGWSGCAPAPPAPEVGKGRQRQGARHVSESQHTTIAVIGIDIGKNSLG